MWGLGAPISVFAAQVHQESAWRPEAVSHVGAQGLEGDFGVLPGHAALLAALRVGHIFYKTGDDTRYVFVSGGFAEVSNNKVIVLAETATRAEDIDTERAAKAKARAEERLRSKNRDIDQVRAEASLQRAVNRLSTAGFAKK